MIGYLAGAVLALEKDEALLNVQGVGYWVSLGSRAMQQLALAPGAEAALFVHTQVREDEIRLFGFVALEQRNLFLKLISVNGVGPKIALAILDHMNLEEVVSAVALGDHHPFTQVSGVGSKTAQRLVVDLQGKLGGLHAPGANPALRPALATPGGVAADARSALMNLGFGEKEADKVVRNHLTKDIALEELIRKGLADLKAGKS